MFLVLCTTFYYASFNLNSQNECKKLNPTILQSQCLSVSSSKVSIKYSEAKHVADHFHDGIQHFMLVWKSQ